MKNINLTLKDNIQSKFFKKKSISDLSKKFGKVFLEIKKDINDKKKTLNILDNKFKLNYKTQDLKKFNKFKTVAFIGMGGSILGAEAIHSFFKQSIKKKIYFINDLDVIKIIDLKKKENISKILFVIISKSGNTVETLSNVFSLNIVKKNSKNIILISEKKNNLLYSLSKKLNLFYVEHRPYVGGRYSVLSEVGMVPAYLMGVNIYKLRSKIIDCVKEKNKTFLKNSSIKLANLINSKKFNSLILLNYSPELEKFLYWYQQLFAESLGKKNKGLLPVISNAPKDHHSLLQLYLDGPKDKLFYIFSYENKYKEKVNIKKNYLDVKSFLNKKKLGKIKDAQRKALVMSLIKNGMPFREFKINNNKEEVLGQLFSYFIIETVILGKLLNINPFDQPAVEQVKVYTKQFLT